MPARQLKAPRQGATAFFSTLLVALLALAASSGAQEGRLTLERITSYPNLTGTAPDSPVWSPDGQRLAFLWNDEGLPFRDVWVVEARGESPRRVTSLAQRFPASPARPPEGPLPEPGLPPMPDGIDRRPGVSEVVWTPDGAALVFLFQGRLFRVDAGGGELAALDETSARRSELAFSPDGTYLSYVEDGDLWLWNQKTNERVRVTDVGERAVGHVPGARYAQPDVELSGSRWSPDGRHVAAHFDDRRNVRKVLIPNYLAAETEVNVLRRDFPGENDHVRAVAIYSVAEGKLRVVDLPERTDRRISNYNWSPDGSRLLVDQNSEDAAHRWIYVVRPEDGSTREVWHDRRETRTTQLWNSHWQSDGEGIVLVSDKDGSHQLYELRLADGAVRRLTEGPGSVVSVMFGGPYLSVSPTTKEVFFEATRRSPYERQIYRMPERGGEVEDVTTLAGVHRPFLSPGGERLAVLHSSDIRPVQLYLVEARAGARERQVTHLPEEFSRVAWIEPRYVTFPSRVDGATLHGRLIEPPNLDRSKRYPAILGPVYPNTVRNRWEGRFGALQQYLAIEGEYLILQVDVRGSSGYGREFREGILLDYGGIDIEDLHSGADYLRSLPYVDPDRIGIWGTSYGGLMTAMSLFKKPGVYRAGVAAAPATNVWHATTGEVHVAGRPQSHPEVYRKSSAASFGEDLADHLMIIHGMQDSVVLFKDSVVLAEKLMMLGKDFDFVVAPSAVHAWSQKDHAALYLFRKLVGHFDRHLGRGGRPASTN